MTRKLFIIDDCQPEDEAMLQALYSRSAESALMHIEKVRATGSGKFMERYYVGYGHRSIADCGTTTMFFEGVSMLAAKAIQDWPLYSGQETSTRFIDMSKQLIIDPVGTSESKVILDRWMDFYCKYQDGVADLVRSKFPQKPDEKDSVYKMAVKARTFDSMRGFLPAGITTQLSWHSNLRQAKDHLMALRHHPTNEIHAMAHEMCGLLAEEYKSSGFDKMDEAVKWDMRAALWSTYPTKHFRHSYGNRSTIDVEMLERYADLLDARPRGVGIPHFLSDLGQLRFTFPLDFGSFRDIQRHRNGVCRMPLLTTEGGFEDWYLEQLSDEMRKEAELLIDDQREAIDELPCNQYEKQYYVALGFKVPCVLTYALPAAVYVMELRSGRRVHPTVRKVVLNEMVPFFEESVPGVLLHIDTSPSDWDVRRGAQTITEKVS